MSFQILHFDFFLNPLQEVAAHSVKLLVIDNLMIVPSMDVYIMINTAVKYTVKRFRQNSVIGKSNFESINHILYTLYKKTHSKY